MCNKISFKNKKFKCIGIFKNVNKDGSLKMSVFYKLLSLDLKFIFIEVEKCFIPFKILKISNIIDDKYNIFFDDITNDDLTLLLKSKHVFIENCDFDKIDLQEEEREENFINLVGYKIITNKNGHFWGEVNNVLKNKTQYFLDVKCNEKNNILIPYSDDFIVNVDNIEKKIYVKNI